ncbi:hypothetical protein KBD61_02940 [Patescibacteria group bacterium]|nr:hypothetical protein [Patescibacteria group bacterium]MBP9709958.1 hypothetical protein [Patescibacteria group bacterium]
MPKENIVPEQHDHPLFNIEEVTRILLRGSEEEREKLRAFHSWSQETLERHRYYVGLEVELRKESSEGRRKRELFGPPPTEEEGSFGNYFEAISFPIRQSVILLRRKGYAVERATVRADGEISIHLAVPQLIHAGEGAQEIGTLKDRGISVRFFSDQIILKPEVSLAGEVIRDACEEFVATLPNLDQPAPDNQDKHAKIFRNNMREPHVFVEGQGDIDRMVAAGRAEAEALVAALTVAQKRQLTEAAHLPLSLGTREDLVLVLGGLKPATELLLRGKALRAKEPILQWLIHTGFPTDSRVRSDGEFEYLIARDSVTLDRLRPAFGSQHHEEYGKLMGFPDTAVEAFVPKRLLQIAPQDIHPDVDIGMCLSQAHWPEELEYVSRWAFFLKMVAPNLNEEKKKKEKD